MCCLPGLKSSIKKGKYTQTGKGKGDVGGWGEKTDTDTVCS